MEPRGISTCSAAPPNSKSSLGSNLGVGLGLTPVLALSAGNSLVAGAVLVAGLVLGVVCTSDAVAVLGVVAGATVVLVLGLVGVLVAGEVADRAAGRAPVVGPVLVVG